MTIAGTADRRTTAIIYKYDDSKYEFCKAKKTGSKKMMMYGDEQGFAFTYRAKGLFL